MKIVGLVGWRGMVGSVLMQRMQEEGDFAHIEPVSMAAASDRMSPNMLPVTITSNFFGARTSCMAALSTYI